MRKDLQLIAAGNLLSDNEFVSDLPDAVIERFSHVRIVTPPRERNGQKILDQEIVTPQ